MTNEEIIIIAPHSAHPFLLKKYRKANSFAKIKIFDKKSLVDLFYASYDSIYTYALMDKFNITYDFAKEALSFFPFLDENGFGTTNHKLIFLSDLKKYIDSHFYHFNNAYSAQLFKNKRIDIYGYNNSDFLLNKILNRIDGVKINYFSYKEKKDLSLLTFDNIENEVLYVLNEICSLIKKGIKSEHIYLYVSSDDYLYLLEKYQNYFNLKINNLVTKSLLYMPICAEFLKLYRNCDDLQACVDEIKNEFVHQPWLDEVVLAANKIDQLQISKTTKIVALQKELGVMSISSSSYKNGISLINGPTYCPDDYIFILGARLNSFPKTFKNNSILTDEEKVQLSLISISEQNRTEYEAAVDLLYSPSHIMLSYAKKSADGEYYPTNIALDYDIKLVQPEPIRRYYSKPYANIILSLAKDLKHLYGIESAENISLSKAIDLPYRSYRNEYTLVDFYKSDDKIYLSYSSINKFLQCQFAYYLDKILHLSEEGDDNFALELGTFIHQMLEDAQRPNFDFELSFNNYLSNQPWDDEKQILVKGRIKKYIRLAIDAILLHQKQFMTNPQFFCEKNVRAELDNKTILTGKIDKAVIVDNSFLVLIDYKTNSPAVSFSQLEYGEGLQLPTYALLARYDKDLCPYPVGGMYIQCVLPSSLKISVGPNDLIASDFKLVGKTNDTYNNVFNFDSTIADGKPSFISGVKASKTFVLSSTARNESNLLSFQQVDEYIEQALSIYLSAAQKIRKNDFAINPKRDTNSTSCQFCPYGDICFVKYKQYIYKEKRGGEVDSGSNNEMV